MDTVKPIRVLIVDDHLMVRKGLSAIIQGIPDFNLVGEAEDGNQAIAMCRTLHPDVILMDLIMPEMSGIDAMRAISANQPKIRIIALTSFPDQQLIQQALGAGACGFLYKDVGIDELVNAIRQASHGQAVLGADVLNIFVNAAQTAHLNAGRENHQHIKLSPRENDVLRLLLDGKETKQIASALNIQPSTVKQALSNLYQKLGVNNRTEAVAVALREKMYPE